MTTWNDFSGAEPELAERARAILSSTTNCVLGTIRADGSPRLSGIDPFWVAGELWIGSMPGSRKAADLARDPRCALHAIPWESRKVREGGTDPGDGDVKVAAVAVPIAGSADEADAKAAFEAERGFEMPEGDLYRLEPQSVTVISVEDDLLVIDRWSAEGGRKTVRRD